MDEYHPGIVARFPLCMALLDRDLVIRAWNGCMEELLNRPTASAVGQPLGNLPEFRGLPIRTTIRRLLEGEEAVHLTPPGGRNGRGPLAAGLSLAPVRGPDRTKRWSCRIERRSGRLLSENEPHLGIR